MHPYGRMMVVHVLSRWGAGGGGIAFPIGIWELCMCHASGRLGIVHLVP